jgi:hypothetical protein
MGAARSTERQIFSRAFTIPASPSGRPCRCVIDTALASPPDVAPEDEGPLVAAEGRYIVAPFALVLLVSEG